MTEAVIVRGGGSGEVGKGKDLFVSEVFGPTFQGEGPSQGRRCYFVRLGGCNLQCVWCDTAYTWDWTGISQMAKQRVSNLQSAMLDGGGAELVLGRNGGYDPREEVTRRSVFAVADDLEARGMTAKDLLVISGGEPLLQVKVLNELVHVLAERMAYVLPRIEIETNGTVDPGMFAATWRHQVCFNVSPKLHSSGNTAEAAQKADPLYSFRYLALNDRAIFKFVIGSVVDLEEAVALAHTLDLPSNKVWLMPEGMTLAEQAQHAGTVADMALEWGFNFTGRLHIQLWGTRRGV